MPSKYTKKFLLVRSGPIFVGANLPKERCKSEEVPKVNLCNAQMVKKQKGRQIKVK